MKLLAIDTSIENCSISYYNGKNYFNKNIIGYGKNSSFVLPMIEQTKCKIHELDGIIYTRGPGSFTGVRIGISVVQGFSIAHNIPTLGFSSLEVMEYGAKQKYQTDKIISSIDARMSEVYLRYNNQEYLLNPKNIDIDKSEFIGVGNGFKAYPQMINCKIIDKNFYPQAQNLIKLALQNINKLNFDIPEALYLRNNIAKKSLKL